MFTRSLLKIVFGLSFFNYDSTKTSPPSMWCTVCCHKCVHELSLSSGLCSQCSCHRQKFKVTSSRSHTQTVSPRWRLTVLLIRYISLLTCLPVWANAASKRWRLPLSAVCWLAVIPIHTVLYSHQTLTDNLIVFFSSQLLHTSKRWGDIAGVMWKRWIWESGWCCLMKAFRSVLPAYLYLFTWGFYDLCAIYCINITWICKVSRRQGSEAAHWLDDIQNPHYMSLCPQTHAELLMTQTELITNNSSYLSVQFSSERLCNSALHSQRSVLMLLMRRLDTCCKTDRNNPQWTFCFHKTILIRRCLPL